MHKLLIIYPHWYPSNLAGVHRARLTGNYLNEFGWKPIILTVKPEYYEEAPDTDMHRLFSPHFTEYRVDAWKAERPRLIGDIGLRAFISLYKKGKEIIRDEKPDFLWIPIPSFYTALLGRFLHEKTGIRYGIDYIDPWVRDISQDRTLRARLSLRVAKLLEPIAVKKASLITGVAEEYYKPVLERNFGYKSQEPGIRNQEPRTKNQEESSDKQKAISNPLNLGIFESKIKNQKSKIIDASFPYGFDPHDHEIEIPNLKLPWDDRPGCLPIVYAGAFMPNSQVFLDTFFNAFEALDQTGQVPEKVHLYFLGTGMYPHKRITAYAADHGLERRVTEIRERFPFLHILNFLAKADKLLIIGSTEKHYTASKTYQVILSKRPFMGIFHQESTAVKVLKETNTDKYLVSYQPGEKEAVFLSDTKNILQTFLSGTESWSPDLLALEPYSARASANALVRGMEEAMKE